MKYYLHDSNAFNDEKVTQLFMEYGYEGLGLFYTLLEKIALQEKPVKTSVLKQQLFVGRKLDKCWKFMESIGLIQSNNGETFNEQLLKYSEKYQVKKEKNSERISQWRENQKSTEDVTRYESVRNTSKVKESKVKEIEVNESKGIIQGREAEKKPELKIVGKEEHAEVTIYPTFDDFWNLYNKKVGREKSEKLWNKIPQADRLKIMDYIPDYIQSQPEAQYRKNPETFLYNKSWNDEIISRTDTSGKSAISGKNQSVTGNKRASLDELENLATRIVQHAANSDGG